MKTKPFQQLLITGLFLFLISSCATDPNIESARLALVLEDYEEVISSALLAIEDNPDNGIGYYYAGTGYAYLASSKDPGDRKESYETARSFFMDARERFIAKDVTSGEAEELDATIIDFWQYEHNQAIQPLSEDIFATSEDSLILSHHHFTNATTINPDSVLSFNLLVEVKLALNDFEGAKEISRHIIYEMREGDLYNFYRLASILMDEQNYDEAITILLEAQDIYPDEIEIAQELANIYLQIGEKDKALESLLDLIERNPDDPVYRLVYASQIYQLVQDLDRQIRKKYDNVYELSQQMRTKAREPGVKPEDIEELSGQIELNLQEAENLIEDSFYYSEKAESHLLSALELDEEDPDVHSTLGVVYQNRAAVLQDKRNVTDDMEEVEKFERRMNEYLKQALPHYKRAAELEEDNPEHWQSLFRIYINLGMEEEAQDAMERAGL